MFHGFPLKSIHCCGCGGWAGAGGAGGAGCADCGELRQGVVLMEHRGGGLDEKHDHGQRYIMIRHDMTACSGMLRHVQQHVATNMMKKHEKTTPPLPSLRPGRWRECVQRQWQQFGQRSRCSRCSTRPGDCWSTIQRYSGREFQSTKPLQRFGYSKRM